ncbi:MAG TPA: T9SS type A sorting domain-containing protein, partial [Elusimicrobiota bacterium]|nr:T9SS type A sorting domain-containing protein [Elusimicrobiota bacterium]
TVPNVFSVCSDGGAFSYGAANVIVPPGSASCGTVFTVVDPGTFPPGSGPAGTLKPLGVGADISAVPPVCGFSITLSYSDADVAGLDESTLVIARYDGARGFWIPLPSRVDPTTNKVTAAQACTSLVQVMGRAPSNNVSEGVAYPVPARTQITFSNLPASARIQIYTVSAEKVRELDADSGGQVVWDLRNESGETVASGTYLARIEKSGQDDVVKVVVQR